MADLLEPEKTNVSKRRKLTREPGERAPAGENEPKPDPTAKATTLSDEQVENIYTQLMNIRAKMSVDLPGITQFYVRVNGGKWTKEHKNKIADSIQGHVRADLV